MKKLYGVLLAGALAWPTAALSQETIDLTVASSHPTVVPWVGMIKTHFMAKTDEILAESGNYKINWNEAFGGQLYKANATLTSVEEGITDVGWVFSFLEAAKLPLSQASSNAPFSTANPAALLDVMQELMETNEAFREEWEKHNLKVLGLTATDLYDIYTKEPISGIADIDGMKLSAPGVLGNWLRGTGANAVDGALTTFYTDIQTGVSDGALTLALGALPIKLYEVAPYIHRFDAGAAFSGAVAINRDTWDGLPEEVQNAMIDAGKYYTQSHGQDLVDRHEFALNKMVELGADQDPPVQIIPMPAEERAKWVNALPNLPADWAAPIEARGIPAKDFLAAYMNGLRARGEEPVRAWDQQSGLRMPDQSDIDGARHGGHPFGALVRLWRWLVDGLAALGTILIGVLMLIICADIVARNLMGSSLPLISELGALTLVMIVYLQLAATVRADRLARTELFFSSFRQNFPRAGALLSAAFDLVGAWLIGLAAWSTVRILGKDYGSGEFIGVPGIATLQTWPFRLLILIGIGVASLEFVFRALSAMRTAVTGKRP